MTPVPRRGGTALLWIFTASGFAGLIYESIWAQYLGLILGHSAYAQVLVLALFMGGMALGAWLISTRSELLARPLMVYAAVEFLLGVVGVGFHTYFGAVSGWSYESLFPMLAPGFSLELARWFVAGLLILPQCVLLGMTFPLMSAGYIRWRPESSGRVLAGLYFSNSLGAAAGAIAATFILLPASGLPGTVLAAGIINILVAISVWPMAKLDQPVASIPSENRSDTARSAPAFILMVAAVTGASSFVYEVSWVRMLSMVLGSTIHAFELMLAAFIAGIAFGGLWLRKRADKLKSARRAAGWAQLAMGCTALSTLFLYNQSFSWIAWTIQTLNRSADSAYSVYNLASAVISMAIMFPTAFFAGMTLPLLTLTLLRGGAGEAAIGKTYAANTLGAIIGVVLAVFVFLPVIGLRLSLWIAALADIVLGVGLLGFASRSFFSKVGRPHVTQMAAVGAAMLLLIVSLTYTRFDPLLMSSVVFRSGVVGIEQDLKVFSHKDGRTASVTLREIRSGQRSIFTNGKPDASISFDKSPALDELTMTAAGILPVLHAPKAKAVAIVGFGSGMTTHFVLGNPDIESVDTIEIEPAMVEAAQFFRPIVERAYSDPRSHVIIDDAKSYFATNRKQYDIIISEPSNPWVNGVASLFTDEFYSFVAKHLNAGGVFAQWIQAYEISPTLINSITRAMLPHFADVRIYAAGDTDWILVASPKERLQSIDSVSIPRHWTDAVRGELAARGIAEDQDLEVLFHGDRTVIQTYADLYPNSGRNSDFFPILQLGAAKARFSRAIGIGLADLKMSSWPVFEVLTGVRPPPLTYTPAQPLLLRLPLAESLKKARAIYASLLDPSTQDRPSGLLLDERLAVEHLRSVGGRCQLGASESDDLMVLTRLATKTIPYLRAEDARRIWDEPAWLKCAPRDPVVRQYLSFIGAVAARDHQRVLLMGQALLDSAKSGANLNAIRPVMNYLIGGMQVSGYASGDLATTMKLEDEFGRSLERNFGRLFLVQAARGKAKPLE